jgi:hypothetical protein
LAHAAPARHPFDYWSCGTLYFCGLSRQAERAK